VGIVLAYDLNNLMHRHTRQEIQAIKYIFQTWWCKTSGFTIRYYVLIEISDWWYLEIRLLKVWTRTA